MKRKPNDEEVLEIYKDVFYCEDDYITEFDRKLKELYDPNFVGVVIEHGEGLLEASQVVNLLEILGCVVCKDPTYNEEPHITGWLIWLPEGTPARS